MTQAPNAIPTAKARQTRVVGLHRQADAWRLALVTMNGAGGPRLAETLSVTDSNPAALDQALSRLRPDSIIGVVPAGQTVWRAVDAAAPAGTAAELNATLELLAEAHTPTGTPTHRRTAGMLTLAPRVQALAVSAWTGELTGWPEDLVKAVTAWAPEPAAIGMLAAMTGRGPGALHVYSDRRAGVIALVGAIPADTDSVPETHPKAVVRVLREDGSEPESWSESVGAIADEIGEATRLSTAHVRPSVAAAQTLLLGPVTDTPEGQAFPADQAWLDQFGVAAGAAAMAASPATHSGAWLSMRALAPRERRSVVEATVRWFAKPARAYTVMAICLLAVLLGPLGVAYSRWSVLKAQAAEADKTKSDYVKAAEEAEFYQALRDKRLPLVKTLAELTGPAPKGIIIESLVVDERKIVVRGTTDSADLVAQWRTALGATGVFDDVRTPVIETGATPIRFDLQATIGQPLRAFASSGGAAVAGAPLPDLPAVEGRNAGGDSRRRPATTDQPRDNTNRNSNRTGARQTGTGAKGETAAKKGEPAAKSQPLAIPGPISDAQIQALDRSGALREWSTRRAASKSPDIDEATRNRLTDEAAKAEARMQALRQGGGGGGP